MRGIGAWALAAAWVSCTACEAPRTDADATGAAEAGAWPAANPADVESVDVESVDVEREGLRIPPALEAP